MVRLGRLWPLARMCKLPGSLKEPPRSGSPIRQPQELDSSWPV
jgi:hypothetical protein